MNFVGTYTIEVIAEYKCYGPPDIEQNFELRIDRPCTEGLQVAADGALDQELVIGPSHQIDLSDFTNGSCEFELAVFTHDDTTMDQNSQFDTLGNGITLTQPTFTEVNSEATDTRIKEVTAGN